MSQENSYLNGIDFSSELAEAHKDQIKTVYNVAPQAQASMSQENTYLKLSGVDFSAELATAEQRHVNQAMRAGPPAKPVPRLMRVPQQALDGPVDAPDGSFLKGFDFSDEMKEVGIKPASAPPQTSTNGYLKGIDFHSANEEVAAAPPQPALVPVQPPSQTQTRANPYLQGMNNFNMQAAQASATSALAEKNLDESDFHRLAAEYRKEETAPKLPQTVDLGSSFTKDLAAAKSNTWKRALDATDWGGDKHKMSMARVSSRADDKDDDDFDLETPGMITNHISSWLDHSR
jgi:hypothetical protein